jgi:hypothetical protein
VHPVGRPCPGQRGPGAFNGENLIELVAYHHAIGILTALVLAPIGALIVVGDRRHLLAWLLLVDSLALATFNFTEQYATLALGLTPRRLSLPGGDLASWTNLPGIVISVVVLVLLFPDGRLPTRRWWPLGLAGAVVAVVPTVALAARPGRCAGRSWSHSRARRRPWWSPCSRSRSWRRWRWGPSTWSRWCSGSAAPERCSASRSSGSPTVPPSASRSACSPRRSPGDRTSSCWGRPRSWPGWASASSGSGYGTSTG